MAPGWTLVAEAVTAMSATGLGVGVGVALLLADGVGVGSSGWRPGSSR